MAELGTRIGSAFVQVGAVFTGFGESLAADVSNAFLAQTFVVGSALESFGQAVFKRFSVPLLIATTANIAQFQALDREIRTVLTLFGTADSLVQDTFGAMAEGIREVALEVGGLERDIADGLYGAISAGVPRGGVFDFLNVAQMAAIADKTADLTSAVDGLTTVTNAFGLEFIQANEIADVMFATVALGKTTFGELAQDIGRVAPLAANAGVSFQELFAIVGALTLQGLKTSESISFLRAAITGLLRPTDELNAVFQAAGFATAELAIPAIGLQAAFALVVDSVEGSTSKLQELIGTSEGVSAILGVTGQNAENFGKVMGGVDNATGGLTRAFEIMDASVGRTFGRLTEAFDRLGNTFGEMASMFAVPVFAGVTDVINRMVEIFTNFRPIVEGLAIAFGTVVGVLSAPIIKDIAAIFGAIAVTIGGLIGGLGLFALTLGKIIKAAVTLKIVTKAVGALQVKFFALQGAVGIAATRIGDFSKAMAASNVVTRLSQGAIGGLGRVMQLFSTNVFVMAGGILAVIAAIGLLIAAIGGALKAQKDLIESQDIYKKGVDQLLDSLGLLNEEIGLPGTKEGVTNLVDFADANIDLIANIEATRDAVGELAAIDLAEAIIVRIVLAGNTPEEALEVAELLERFTQVEINLDLGDLEDATFLTNQFAEGVLASGEALAVAGGDPFLSGNIKAGSKEAAQGLSDLFKIARESGDLDLFRETFEQVVETVGGPGGINVEALSQLGGALESAFETDLDIDLDKGFLGGFFTGGAFNLTDFETFIASLEDAGVKYATFRDDFSPEALRIPGGQEAFEVPDPFAAFSEEELAIAQKSVEEFGFTLEQVLFEIPEGGIEVYSTLLSDMDGLFQTARDNVLGAMNAIRDGVLAQTPLLDIYGGAVEQSFAEWEEGQNKFQADLKAVTALRDTLIAQDLPDQVIAAFDAQPIDKQAWLAGLGPENLEAAIGELAESFTLADEAAKERIVQSFGGIMDAALVELGEGYVLLQVQADEQGLVVGDKFDQMFSSAASVWPITAATWMAALEAQISRPLSGPVIGAPTFGNFAGIGAGQTTIVNNTTVVNPTTSNLPADIERANLVNVTSLIE